MTSLWGKRQIKLHRSGKEKIKMACIQTQQKWEQQDCLQRILRRWRNSGSCEWQLGRNIIRQRRVRAQAQLPKSNRKFPNELDYKLSTFLLSKQKEKTRWLALTELSSPNLNSRKPTLTKMGEITDKILKICWKVLSFYSTVLFNTLNCIFDYFPSQGGVLKEELIFNTAYPGHVLFAVDAWFRPFCTSVPPH